MSRRLISLCALALWALAAPLAVSAAIQDISRFVRMTIGDETPAEPCPTDGVSLHIYEPDGQFFLCLPSGLAYTPTVPFGPSAISGIISSPRGVDSIHYNTITLTNTCGLLGSISHVNVIAGPTGATCILPDPALLTTPGRYSIVVEDANRVTLAPSGTNILNGFNAPLPSILGPLAMFDVERRDDNTWLARVYSSVGYGEPMTSVCTSFGGSTNVSSSGAGTWVPHTLSCLIPANTITTGTILDVCVGTRLVTGSGPPQLEVRFLANSTVLWRAAADAVLTTNVPGNTARLCLGIMGAAAPSASSALYTAFPMNVQLSQWDSYGSSIGDPVLVNTSVDVLLTFESYLSIVGTGTNSLEQQIMDVRGARFAN